MNKDRDYPRAPSPWSSYQQQQNGIPDQPARLAYATPPSNPSKPSERPNPPTRSSTLGPQDPDRKLSAATLPQSRSEDLNHSSYLAYDSPPKLSPNSRPYASSSRPATPTAPTLNTLTQPSSSGHSDGSHRQHSATSHPSDASTSLSSSKGAPTTASSTSTSLASTPCFNCQKSIQGPFVRALGSVFHLECFTCMDCGDVVASKFFPIELQNGRQAPLCERDYFRRLNLICAKCGMALRGSYITACNKKYHVEHFTCSLCSTLFGPQDSYYEHDGDVFCHFHYSTRFATKCAGCNSAILKQFVEINRNMRDECWHPECYMINKFWNVKVSSRRPTSIEGESEEPAYVEEERRESPASLKDRQVRMEQQVYRIWTVLSAFEESSAACISDMLRQVSNGAYLDAIRMAEKFILHVEVLFGAIDDLEFHFASLSMKGMSHVREARMLCRKTVELFTLLSHTQETGARRMGMTQELLALVTGLAHYLKILIRIALTGALKLERERSVREPMNAFLDKLHLLAVQGGNPAAKRILKGSNGEVLSLNPNLNLGTQGVTYGFRSLAPENAGESPFSPTRDPSSKVSNTPPSDLCVRCNVTVEEDCVRLGTYQRWHSHCVQCVHCGKVAAVPLPPSSKEFQSSKSGDEREKDAPINGSNPSNNNPGTGTSSQPPKVSTARRPPANVGLFVYDPDSMKDTPSFGEVPGVIVCVDHARPNFRAGFQPVQRLEQYAFLLNVALRRLYLLLKKQGVVPMSPVTSSATDSSSTSDPYSSGDIMRMKSVHLDRKLSATVRLPKRSTIIESPAGRSVHPSEMTSQRTYDSALVGAYNTPPAPPPIQAPIQHMPPPQTQASPPQPPYLKQPPNQYQGSPPSQHATPRGTHGHGGKLPLETQGRNLGPSLGRNNGEVTVVDDSAPSSPANDDPAMPRRDDALTLADIPQLMEAAHAREHHRSLPRESSVPYIAELSALELAIVKYSALLVLSRSPLKDQFDLDEILDMVEMKKSGFWGKLFKGGDKDKKNIKKKGVFGVPLELLVEREGSDSMLGATRASLRVPSFIDDVISAMRQMDMSVEGIFRKNGNIRRLRELTEAIDRDASSVDLSQDNPVQLAALLKKFLRELPEPLLTFKLHRLFVASQSFLNEDDRKRYLHLVSLLLPKSHRDTMEILFVFLKWVASFAHLDAETGSKMDLDNLATVISPNILHSRNRDPSPDELLSSTRVVTSLLENQDIFFTVPEEFLSILNDQEYFANSLELPSKEFMKKCDTYMRVKGRPTVTTPYLGPNNNMAGPRYPPLNSPTMDRPPPGSPFSPPMNQNPRPPQQPPIDPLSSSPPSSQLNIPQNHGMHNLQRTPQGDEWQPTPPTPWQGPAYPSSPSSRPTSLVGPSRNAPPDPNQTQNNIQYQYNNGAATPNGYPSTAVRQRT